MRKFFLLVLCITLFLSTGCNSRSSNTIEIENLKKQIQELKAENEKLKTNSKSSEIQSVSTEDLVLADSTNKENNQPEIDLYNAVTVTLVEKKLIPKDTSNGQFSDFVSFTFRCKNNTDKEIVGFRGNGIFLDMFGSAIQTLKINFDSKNIEPNQEITNSDLGLEVNQFLDEDIKIRDTELSRMKFTFAPSTIIFKDGTKLGK